MTLNTIQPGHILYISVNTNSISIHRVTMMNVNMMFNAQQRYYYGIHVYKN